MTHSRGMAVIGVLAVASLALAGCASNEAAAEGTASASTGTQLNGTLNGIGSSAQALAEKTWIAGFQKANSQVTVNYDPQGSGAGQNAFIAGGAAFAGSDVALSADHVKAGGFASCAAGSSALDLPVYISPIAIAYHLAGVDTLRLDPATLAGIFKGSITSWDDAAIAATNPGVTLPAKRITVVHRSDKSGTTFNFTDYLHQVAPSVWDAAPSEVYPYQVGDAAKGTSGVADAIANAEGTIGYLDKSGAGTLATAELKVGDTFTKLTPQGAAAVVAASPVAQGRPHGDLALAIDRGYTKDNAWPLVLVSYLITCQQYKDPATATLAKAYASYVVTDAAQQAAQASAGSAPLAAGLAAKVNASIATIK